MNTRSRTKIASLLALAMSLGSGLRAEEPEAPKPPDIDRIVEALNSSGLEKDVVEKIRKSIESANPESKTHVFKKTIIVGPDGKAQESEGDSAPLKKLLVQLKDSSAGLEKLLSGPGGAAPSPVVKVSGKAVIIGPDGQKKEIDLKEPEGLDIALREVLKDVKLDAGSLDFLSVGPGVLVKPEEDQPDLEKKVGQLQSDVAEIRAMLKKIEEKLR